MVVIRASPRYRPASYVPGAAPPTGERAFWTDNVGDVSVGCARIASAAGGSGQATSYRGDDTLGGAVNLWPAAKAGSNSTRCVCGRAPSRAKNIELEPIPIAGGADKMVAALDQATLDVTRTATPYLAHLRLAGVE
jgi:hypothetical protein